MNDCAGGGQEEPGVWQGLCHVCWVITRYWRCERIRQHLPRARCKGHLKNRNTPVHVEDHFGHRKVSIPHQGETEGRNKSGFPEKCDQVCQLTECASFLHKKQHHKGEMGAGVVPELGDRGLHFLFAPPRGLCMGKGGAAPAGGPVLSAPLRGVVTALPCRRGDLCPGSRTGSRAVVEAHGCETAGTAGGGARPGSQAWRVQPGLPSHARLRSPEQGLGALSLGPGQSNPHGGEGANARAPSPKPGSVGWLLSAPQSFPLDLGSCRGFPSASTWDPHPWLSFFL